jgi:hypothetical protein
MKNGLNVWVELNLASQGEHRVRPYNICVGTNSSCERMCYMTFALPFASKSNGTDPQ